MGLFLKAEAKAWTLETKTRGLDSSRQRPRPGPSSPRPELLSPRPIRRPNMTHNLMPIYHTPLT